MASRLSSHPRAPRISTSSQRLRRGSRNAWLSKGVQLNRSEWQALLVGEDNPWEVLKNPAWEMVATQHKIVGQSMRVVRISLGNEDFPQQSVAEVNARGPSKSPAAPRFRGGRLSELPDHALVRDHPHDVVPPAYSLPMHHTRGNYAV